MRWLVGLLIALGALALASPSAIGLWQMHTSVASFEVIGEGGAVQRAEIGPRAYWPRWAQRPRGAKSQVRAYFGQTARDSAFGYADIAGFADAARVQREYGSQLRAAGWDVALFHVTLALPEVPARSARLCQVLGRKPGRSLLLSVTTDTHGMSRLHWRAAPQRATVGARPGACTTA